MAGGSPPKGSWGIPLPQGGTLEARTSGGILRGRSESAKLDRTSGDEGELGGTGWGADSASSWDGAGSGADSASSWDGAGSGADSASSWDGAGSGVEGSGTAVMMRRNSEAAAIL